MTLTFADTHNMIAFLTKLNASKGFDQIVDFLNAQVIQYALMVNPTIYVSCIKKFWSFIPIKRSNDDVRLQALIDRKKVIITEDSIRQALRLDDDDGMSAKRTTWNEFSSSMASAVICLATDRKFNFSKYIFNSLIRNVDSPSKFLMYPRFLQLMINAQIDDLSAHNTKYTSPAHTQKIFANIRRIGKGFSRVDTPLFDGMLVQQQAQDVKYVAEDENADNEVSAEPTSPTPALTPPPSPTQEHGQEVGEEEAIQNFSIEIEEDEDVTLEEVDAEVTMVDADAQGRMEESQAKVYYLDLQHAKKVHSMQDIDEAEPTEVEEVIEVVTIAKLMTEDEAFSKQLEAELNANINWNDVVDEVKRKERQDNTVMRYQALKRKLVIEAQARKNMMLYLKNMAGFKMDFFRGMTCTDIRPIFEKNYKLNQAFLKRVEEEVTGQEEE
nr:hypothetical protein [Tanacetum cinerariifolium]